MPVPDECPRCGKPRGEEWSNLPSHLRNGCPENQPDDDGGEASA